MLDAFSAEVLKIRHHKATWFLVWAYPILFTIVLLIAIGVGLAGGDQRPGQVPLGEWIEDTVIIWIAPSTAVGRYLLAAFAAVVFAGEYGWNTWKLIVPHRSRMALIAAKYAVFLVFLSAAFALTAIIATVGLIIEDWATGENLPAGLTFSYLMQAQGTYALTALAPLLVTLAYASFAAIMTRSTIAALVISLVAVTVEELLYKLAPVLSVKAPTLVEALYWMLPGYHLGNMFEWISEGTGVQTQFPDGSVFAQSLATSTAIVAAWIIGLVGATFFAFKRQDIN